MMIEQATVLHYQDGKALVQCQAKQGCGSCAVKSSCGSRALSGLVGERVAPQFEIAVDQVLEKGDQIQLGLAEKTLLGSVFLLYGVPLLTRFRLKLPFWRRNHYRAKRPHLA